MAQRSVKDNLCMMHSAYNPQTASGAVHAISSNQRKNQRVGAAAGGADGSGNGDPAGAEELPLGGFGFFGLSTVLRAALGGGPAG
jgi:hypothetical protein